MQRPVLHLLCHCPEFAGADFGGLLSARGRASLRVALGAESLRFLSTVLPQFHTVYNSFLRSIHQRAEMLSVAKGKVQGFSARERKQRGRKAALMRRVAPSLGMEMASICCGLRDGYLLDLRCVDGDDLACILENVEIGVR